MTDVYASISKHGFTPQTLQIIDNLINDIYNGNTNFDRFNTPEHAGLCCVGKVLIGAEAIASYARSSLSSGTDARAGEAERPKPSNWKIDEVQEHQHRLHREIQIGINII